MHVCFCFKQKTAYDMRINDWSSDVCSSDRLRAYAGLVIPHRIRLERLRRGVTAERLGQAGLDAADAKALRDQAIGQDVVVEMPDQRCLRIEAILLDLVFDHER